MGFFSSKSQVIKVSVTQSFVLEFLSTKFKKMGKLNVSMLRYLSKDQLRVLTAVEMGMKNHELVPKALVVSIAQVRSGVARILMDLCRNRLVFSFCSQSKKMNMCFI